MQTPNVTCPPVLSAVLRALERGVHVHIVTSERLMILEQLVTAGTTTAQCMRRLIRRYKRCKAWSAEADEEARLREPGTLRIHYYRARIGKSQHQEPVQSHLKLTIVDGQWVVLGSGNMDRASWYTSQELGVAFFDQRFAIDVQEAVNADLFGRKKLAFDSVA